MPRLVRKPFEWPEGTMQPTARLLRLAASFALLLLSVQPASAQTAGGSSSSSNPLWQPSSVTGVVQSQNSNAELSNIKVTLSTASGEPVDTLFTNSRGIFTFAHLPAGSYVVTVNAEGYEPYRDEIQILDRPGVRMYIMLRVAKSDRPTAPGNAVSARELALPQKGQEALHKGLDALYTKHDPAGSLVFFGQVLQIAPDFYEAYYDQGVAYLKLHKMVEAEAALRKAIDMSKEHFAEPYITLASLFTDGDRFADAETMVRIGLGIQPNSWQGHYELARALLGEGLPVEAELSALEARRLQPNFPMLYIVLANIQFRLGRNESVVQDLDTYLKLDPDGPYSVQAKQLKEKTEKLLGRSAPSPGR